MTVVSAPRAARRWYASLSNQVIVALAAAVLLGVVAPDLAVAMKPLGDGFIKLIRMIIGLVIFMTIVPGISDSGDLKSAGRVGGRALLYFELVSTLALLIGLTVGNLVRPGAGFGFAPTPADTAAVAGLAGKAHEAGIIPFLLNIIPNTFLGAITDGDILQVVLVSILSGAALARLGERGRPIRTAIDHAARVTFSAVHILMRAAPLGAFGAMAFTVGRYGLGSLALLAKLIATFYVTGALFVVVVLGAIARIAGFSIFRLMVHIKEEILLVLGTSSSDPALPTLMEKLEQLGCPRGIVGLVVPTGYVFNTDGSSIYITLAALFVAQATGIDLTLKQQIVLMGVATLTSKGASGVSGASLVALIGTLSVNPMIPVAGVAIIVGIDRFMSQVRALVNMLGNAVAAIVMARWEGSLSADDLRRALP